MTDVILETRNLKKSFGKLGVAAAVSLTVKSLIYRNGNVCRINLIDKFKLFFSCKD